jgi:hypothetical protein
VPQILAVALVVSVVTTLTEIIVDNIADPTNDALSIAGSLSTQAVALLGTVVLSGFLCRLVGKAQHGGERVRIGRVLRTLPWVQLVVADVLVTVLFVAGLIALIIPGLVILNLLAVVGPVIEIERRSALAGLRRSAHLVRHRFWPVALLATLPTLLVGEIESTLPDPHGAPAILEVLAVRGVAVALIEAAIGLILVELCYRLITLDSSRTDTSQTDSSQTDSSQTDSSQTDSSQTGSSQTG